MAGDVPAGAYTAVLVGAWWPQPPAMLHAAAEHWNMQQQLQEQYAHELHAQWKQLASHNQGHTIDDLVFRFQQGEKHHLDLAEKYKAKADAFEMAAGAMDVLREGLRGVAADYNQRITGIQNSNESTIVKTAEIEKLIAEANGFAAHKSGAAVAAISDATQKILTAEGVDMSLQQFVQSQGGAGAQVPTGGGHIGFGGGRGSEGAVTSSGPGVSGGHIGFEGGHGPSGGLGGSGPREGGGHIGFGGVHDPGRYAPIAMPAGAVHAPGGAVPNSPLPSVGSGGLSPAALAQGMSPNSLGQSFMSGMATGQPAGSGAQSLSSGAVQAMQSTPPQPPGATPPLATPPAISVPMAGGSIADATGSMDASTAISAGPTPTSGAGAMSVAPAVMTGGSWSAPAAPVAGGPVAPAGPLPAYGSDLRPPVVAPPAMPAASTVPVSGTPVAPSASSSPSAGGPLVSPVERAASGAAAGQVGASSSATMAGASAISATTGAAAGAVSTRAAEQQRLQRLVDAVARQEPRLSWAAGLRDDGTTNLLVTDLAAGWIPAHVRLPAHMTVLEPTARRRDASVVELLGAVVVAAAHEPNAYVAEPGADAPVLSGDRAARSAGPKVDELGPALVDAVRRRDGLPRIALAVAAPAVRKTGVLENEARLLRARVADIQHSVLNAYPNHDPAAAADWMLLAAIEALVDDHEYLANYHLAWFNAYAQRGGS